MRRIFFLFLIFCFTSLSAFASENVESEILPMLSEPQEEDVEVLQGFVEYYPDGTIFFDNLKEHEGVFLNIRTPMSYDDYSVLNIEGVNYEDIKNKKVGAKFRYANETYVDNFVTGYVEQLGKFSYGTTYGADIDLGQYEYNTKFFARYDEKHYAFQVAYGKDNYMSTGNQADYIYITPEWKIGKGFVIRDTFKANVLGTRCDNSIMLRYTPQFIKEQPLDVGVGVGQTFYQDGDKKNVVRFETTLRL